MNKVLILCVGNYLMGDEGVGVHFAKLLEDEKLPSDFQVIDGGSGGFKLMEYLEEDAGIILVDAALDENPAGTIRLITPKFASDFPKAMSTHEIGLKDLVESLALLGRLPKVNLFIVSIDTIQPLSVALSQEIKACLPELRKQVLELGLELLRQPVTLPLATAKLI